MDMMQAAVFLAGSILIGMGLIVIMLVVILINNLFHDYWKPVQIFMKDSWNINPPPRFATPEELKALEEQVKKDK